MKLIFSTHIAQLPFALGVRGCRAREPDQNLFIEFNPCLAERPYLFACTRIQCVGDRRRHIYCHIQCYGVAYPAQDMNAGIPCTSSCEWRLVLCHISRSLSLSHTHKISVRTMGIRCACAYFQFVSLLFFFPYGSFFIYTVFAVRSIAARTPYRQN